ncbi:DUF2202 domain-containing protein [Polaribacter sp.]|uniref:DUF2202 domain-containing protein n=1 Tax=Polaribacter sp. TaxID=1920175 RepID=UPI003EF4F9E4
MKNRYHIILILITTISFTFLYACSSADSNEEVFEDINETTLIDADKAALLFMLEEEKLARDTYIYLNNVWSINQFNNINKSEQTHMDAVENLLIQNNIAYTILPMGEFENQNLQNYYNQFKIDGAKSKSNALQIGATIEDLDIVDLQNYIAATNNTSLIAVFENLECGSRNHLKSFVKSIENAGDSYTPQFLTQTEYDAIISESQEQCN